VPFDDVLNINEDFVQENVDGPVAPTDGVLASAGHGGNLTDNDDRGVQPYFDLRRPAW